ncbi:MAG: phosphatidylinositol-specific phospholipase C [Eubacteriales bacterium]
MKRWSLFFLTLATLAVFVPMLLSGCGISQSPSDNSSVQAAGSSDAAQTVTAQPLSRSTVTNPQIMDTGENPFKVWLSMKHGTTSSDLRLVLAEKGILTADKELTVTLTLSASVGSDRVIPLTLGQDGGDFSPRRLILAGSDAYTPAPGVSIYVTSVESIPYGSFTDLTVDISDGSSSLYNKSISYGNLYSSDPSFTAGQVENLSAQWMSFLSDSLSVKDLSIPGTHDSGAAFQFVFSQTQNTTIAEQLEMGIRGLDMRCKVNKNGGFDIYHGIISQNLTFDEVLASCKSFLEAHPGETILMCVKEENDSNAAFESTLRSYIEQDSDLWYTDAGFPKLETVRGKIVLLRRFGASGTLGINFSGGWADNTTFDISAGGCTVRVQDFYQVGTDSEENLNNKWNAITAVLDYAASTAGSGNFCICFTSGYTGTFGITNVSNYINPKLAEKMASSGKARYGLIYSDFVTPEHCRGIYLTNFEQ